MAAAAGKGGRVVALFFHGSVDEFGAVIAVKLHGVEGDDPEDVLEGDESPGESLVEQSIEENPARKDVGG